MNLTVSLRDGYVEYPIEFAYITNERGELDIIDTESDLTVATYNANSWVSVYRDKEDDEEWPDFLLEPKKDEPAPDPHEGVLGGDIDGSKLGYTVKIPGMENPPSPDDESREGGSD